MNPRSPSPLGAPPDTAAPKKRPPARGRPQTTRRPPGITARAVLLGMALIPVNAYWVILAELRWYMILTLNPLFVTPVFFLLALVGLNALIRRVRPQAVFRRSELLTVYVMLTLSCTVATHDYVINLMSIIGWGQWFATPENQWTTTLFPHFPRWPLMWNKGVLEPFFEGGANLYEGGLWRFWLKPLSYWVAFMLVSFGVMFCVNALIRKTWIEDTKLSFPAVRLPVAMLGLDVPRFFGSRLMWLGALFPLLSGTLNGLAVLYPSLPHFQTRARWHVFVTPPWNRIGALPTSYYPFAIGLGYFVPLDVLFSCWFFYLFMKAQRVLGHYLGVAQLPDFPYDTEQSIGAWTTYGFLLLYVTRHHWRRLLENLVRDRAADDGEELLPPRLALLGVLVGIALLIAFWHALGMTLVPALISVGLYFLLSLSITRVRAEAASQHTVWDLEPMRVLPLLGTRFLTTGTLVGAGLSHWFWRLNRSHAMPAQLESLKIGHTAGLTARQLALPMILATIAACLAGPWAVLHVGYREGMATRCLGFARWTGIEMFSWLQTMLTGGRSLEWPRLLAVGGASGLTALLWVLRNRYTSLWFHPLGYCAGPGLIWVWFPFLLAWVGKGVILRYGGQRMYRRLIPFFLGLVLGDYVIGSLSALLSPLLRFQGYQIFH